MAQCVKTVWVNDQAPARNATNLNKQEQGIFDNSTHVNSAHAPSDAEANHADTVLTSVAQTFTEPQRTTVEVGANALALTDKQTLSFTATAADITIASQTSGQAGTFRVLSSGVL